MDLETLRRIWEILMDAEEYDLAHAVSEQITLRTIQRNAVIDHVHGKK